ncbi:MAG: M23 family metallopeptidase [Acidobacteria bacterium]|nr:MAG: M23 family metallopeptidase [Acidobacteriota bacterium]
MPSFDSQPSHRLRNLAVVIILVILIAFGYAWFRGTAPSITASNLPAAIGQHRLVTFDLQSPSGIASVEAHYVQNGKTIPIARRNFAARRWFSTGDSPIVVHFSVQAGRADTPGLEDGKAELVVTARTATLRGAESSFDRILTISTIPPSAYAMSTQVYLNQGGSAVVVYHTSKSTASSGVEMAGTFFPGYPLPNAAPSSSGTTMFAFFAFPYDAPSDSQPHLVARDAAGNQVTASLPVTTFPKQFRHRTLVISDDFIQRVVMPIIANMGLKNEGDPVQNFLEVNRTLRQTETQQLVDVSKQTAPKMLWQGPFLQLGHAAVEAVFADFRTYTYHGQVIDHETHLGYDLAAVRHTPVKAANAGRVVWTKYFGIYGNCVLIDHGNGLMSLYAHLNDFTVKPGEMVAKGQLIAHSDSTGLAGGDHLHFSMLLDGVQVNPLEWWDPHWVKGRIEAKLQEFTAAATPAAAPPAK